MANQQRTLQQRAFTLIELLVVVAIIGLLVGILLPAFGAVRTKARVTQTTAQFSSLDTGLNMFRSESALGGALPPSASDNKTASEFNMIANPLGLNNTDKVRVSGAHLLAQAMVGADRLGTPGFRDLDRDGNWWNDTHRGGDGSRANPYGAYALDAADGQTATRRYGGGGYVDDKMKERLRSLVDLVDEDLIQNLDCEAVANNEATNEPLFVDSWGTPILYYRANRASFRITTDMSGTPGVPGVYTQQDNAIITGTDQGSAALPGLDFGPGTIADEVFYHAIYMAVSPDPDPANLELVEDIAGTDSSFANSFVRFVIDPSVKARPTPFKKDSYLLISAGPDARYGTDDDVTNWDRRAN